MKVPNYGQWEGDQPGGHHPPACTCYACNELKLRRQTAEEEQRRSAEYERRIAQVQQHGRPGSSTLRPRRSNPGRRQQGRRWWPGIVVAALLIGGLIGGGYAFGSGNGGSPPDAIPVAVSPAEPPTAAVVATQSPTSANIPIQSRDNGGTPDKPTGTMVRTDDSGTPAPSGDTMSPDRAGPLNAEEVADWIVSYTSEERAKAGLPALERDPAIDQIALSHSKSMGTSGQFSHVIGGRGSNERAFAAGYDCKAHISGGAYLTGLSENISKSPRIRTFSGTTAWGNTKWKPSSYFKTESDIAKSIVSGWMSSPGHRANIVSKTSKRIGVGVYAHEADKHGWVSEEFYSTQNFSACD